MGTLIKKFSDISIADVAEVGGKNSSLGEMFTQLTSRGIKLPDGFATTAFAFKNFLEVNKITDVLQKLMSKLDTKQFTNLRIIGEKARQAILKAKMPTGSRK
jgi:pyruvate,water dikinase